MEISKKCNFQTYCVTWIKYFFLHLWQKDLIVPLVFENQYRNIYFSHVTLEKSVFVWNQSSFFFEKVHILLTKFVRIINTICYSNSSSYRLSSDRLFYPFPIDIEGHTIDWSWRFFLLLWFCVLIGTRNCRIALQTSLHPERFVT